MPLKACPDCSKDVSDAAPACPHCGRPLISTVETAIMGIRCPNCWSCDYKKRKHVTGIGLGLFFGGIVAAFFTFGVGLVLCVISVFLCENWLHCKKCGWQWKL